MKRLTSKRTWEEAEKDLQHELGYSYIWKRLNEVENILGADYDLDQLKKILDTAKSLTDLESLPIVQELREKLAWYEQLEAEGRIKILPKGKKGTCGGCRHFHRISGMQRGTCDIKEQRVDRWGNPHEGWGRFESGRSKPACKQYKDAEDLER